MSADLLHTFPFYGQWLRVCSYIMFALSSTVFLYFHFLGMFHFAYIVKTQSLSYYCDKYLKDLNVNLFWGIYSIAFTGLLNYLILLCTDELANSAHIKGMITFVYVLWWYDFVTSLICSWGITFIIWKDHYFKDGSDDCSCFRERTMTEYLKSLLLLSIIPLVVVSTSGGLLMEAAAFQNTFNRNVHLITLVVSILLWLHSFSIVLIILTIFFWNLYVNKLPPLISIFTLFIVLGPLGMGGYGSLIITKGIQQYVTQYYPVPTDFNNEASILVLVIPWIFRIFGLLFCLIWVVTGYFFTVIVILYVISFLGPDELRSNDSNKKIYHYHRGWWTMAFPLGTMSLASNELYVEFGEFVPIKAFRIVSVMYAGTCIVWAIVCVSCTILCTLLPNLRIVYYGDVNLEEFSDHKSDLETLN